MSMPDPLFRALGMPDSSGEVGAALGGVSEDQRSALERLADPMRMMKLFAVAFQTGSNDEVVKYMTSFESLLNNVEASVDAFVAIDKELDAALDVVGQVIPSASLASGSAAASSSATADRHYNRPVGLTRAQTYQLSVVPCVDCDARH